MFYIFHESSPKTVATLSKASLVGLTLRHGCENVSLLRESGFHSGSEIVLLRKQCKLKTSSCIQ